MTLTSQENSVYFLSLTRERFTMSVLMMTQRMVLNGVQQKLMMMETLSKIPGGIVNKDVLALYIPVMKKV